MGGARRTSQRTRRPRERGSLSSSAGMSMPSTVGQVLRVATALEADIEIRLRWRGEALDRLMDRAHAGLVEAVVQLLHDEGWETAVEVSFSIFGERGSIDVLARHDRSRLVLVVEVKSVVPDSQAMLHGLDRKTRLAPEIARGRGWSAGGVARLLVIGDSSTSRRRVAAFAETYATAFPMHGWAVRRWLREPAPGMSGILFLPYARAGITSSTSPGAQRVRKRGFRSESCHTPGRGASGPNSTPRPR